MAERDTGGVARVPDLWHHQDALDADFEYADLDRQEVLGIGGNATVYATTAPDGTPLAIKEPHVGDPVPDNIAERFEREARLWHQITSHPNVITILASGTTPRPWLALERVQGGNLREYDLGVAETLWIGVRLADALAYAHEAGVAHHDITPSNVLLRETAEDTWSVPALTDWGIGTLLEERTANAEGLSPRYAAPEQFDLDRFGRPHARTDIYQLGTILYEQLTGRTPFVGTLAEVRRAVLEEDPPAATGIDPTLPSSVDDVLDRALATHPDDRFESAGAFAVALADVLATETGYQADLPDRETASVTLRTTTPEYDRAATLDAEGFVELTEEYFARRELAPPLEALRRGLDLVDVRADRAVPRDLPTDFESGTEDAEAERMADGLVEKLRTGVNHAVLGPPGSGKSTVCKRVACVWFDEGYGPVFYRESGRATFDDPEALTRLFSRTEDHALVVVEDAVRPEAEAVFELLKRIQNSTGVSILIDAREEEWRTAGGDKSTVDSDPISEGKQALRTVFIPRPDRETNERFIEHVTTAVANAPDIDPVRLTEEVRQARATAGADNTAPGELFYLIHRLTALIENPLADAEETTTLTERVRAVREDLAALGEPALDIGMVVNLLNAAGVGVYPELVYAVAPDDPITVADAIDCLDGETVFPRKTDWSSGTEPYPAVHEAWSAEYLAGCLEAAGEDSVRQRFGRVLTGLLAIADESERRDRIADELYGQAPYLDRVADAPGDWVENTLDQLLEFGERQPRLAPLFGTAETAAYDLPAVCPEPVHEELLQRRGEIQRRRSAYDAARAEWERALERAQATGDQQREAESLRKLGQVFIYQGEYDAAREYVNEGLAIYRDIGDRHGEARSLTDLAEIARKQGKHETAWEYANESLTLVREIGNRRHESWTLNLLSLVAYRQSKYETALEYANEDLAICRDIGDRDREARSLHTLGEIARKQGKYETAWEYLNESLTLKREIGDRRGEAQSLNSLGLLAVHQGKYDTAQEYFEESLTLWREIGSRSLKAQSLHNLGDVAYKQGEYELAQRYFEQSLAMTQNMSMRHGEATNLNYLGKVAIDQGQYDTAREYVEESLALRRKIGDRHGQAQSLHDLGQIARNQGEYNTACERFETAINIFTDIDVVREELDAIEARARVAVETDTREAAIEWCERGLARIEEAELDGLDEQRDTFEKVHPDR